MRDAVTDAAKPKSGKGSGVGQCAGAQRLFPADDIKPDQKAVRAAGNARSDAGAGAETQERELEARIAIVMGVFSSRC